MKITNDEKVSTTLDVWCDIEKIEYHDTGYIIYYTEKDEKSS